MENIRLILAVVLSMMVFIAYQYFFGPKPPQGQSPVESQEIAEVQQSAQAPAQEAAAAITPAPAAAPIPEIEAPPGRPARDIIVDTPLYHAVFTEKGAGLTSLTLKDYFETQGENADPKKVLDLPPGAATMLNTMQRGSLGNLETAIFQAQELDDIQIKDQDHSLTFTYKAPSGIVVNKIYTFHPNSYAMDCQLTVANNTLGPINDNLTFILNNTMPTDKSSRIVFNGPVALVDNTLEEFKVSEKKPEKSMEGTAKWVGLTWRYFMSGIIFPDAQEGSVKAVMESLDDLVQTRFTTNPIVIPPGQTYSFSNSAFFGPKEGNILEQAGMDQALHFGFFHVIAKPCLWLMKHLYNYIPNYGVVIILLTLLIKVVLWPLGNKSYRSMEKMKKLQPLMQELREKYKDDKQKMNQEVFALYKTFKVNPMGGCWPMLIQIPIFIAFYKMLYAAIELRHSPFIWWITDLSAPDRLFHLPFKVPFMAEPYGIPVLTLIMGASMLLQQKMSPPPGDPTQARMMMLLPLVFLFIFINFPSGLVLYWLVNNVISIAQQYYIGKTSS
ncbi:YidC/Oxa1 family membrane protein insertase [Desulfatibacillum alkenivorans DSM 16219]|jgi:YidC/Oxa1 family membrane protein insertase|uniref:Membrane protein insertase YidC n=1 Tax=Desulfatibacillum alkenivorans DSM 16219 TaxID=1121393 RepID=A0A1M6SBT4_9BACT|nr:membrane protein insertase YidC [Desulfatibacillum alkenivorans]SHK42146.1 YidC/Oxa1 family membrane protein insertase [Desulfatibacillum alkenivorans DSM 16219]